MSKFDFSTMNLMPKKCIVTSRSECCTRIKLGKHVFNMPVVPANMECIVDDHVAEKLARADYFYIHHRFQEDSIPFIKRMREQGLTVSISVGVNQDAYALLLNLKEMNLVPDFITIDIAHGHAVKMESLLRWINGTFAPPCQRPYIIAGNVCTPEAVRDLEAWGADAIKVGIGPGSACTTYVATGFGSRNMQASCVRACAQARRKEKTKIIADGGIKEPGDIAKAIALGADMVMIGGMFSACTDSPGKTVMGTDGHTYKEFWGSASASATGKTNRIEGIKTLTRSNHKTVLEQMKYLGECLQSSISYAGGNDLTCLADVEIYY